MSPPVRTATALVAAVAVLGAACAGPSSTTAVPAGPSSTTAVPAGPGSTARTAWTVYHHDPAGGGVDTSGTTFSPARPAWTSPALDGQLYGEPLEAGGRVLVATEADTVYALSARTGRVLWATTVGTPVPAGALPCGNIRPVVGITSTPVLDTARNEVFVVDGQLRNGVPAHELVGLDPATGAVRLRQDVDPRGAATPALLQRTGLTLDDGRVVFGFGGNYGDCSNYHGWVESVPEGGGPAARFQVDHTAPGQDQGAVWMGGGAPVVDSSGNIWVSAGNGSVTTPGAPYDDSDSVLELSPALTLVAWFAPATWYADNAGDLDLGSSPPALLAGGTVLQAGKSHRAYLLRRSAPGGVGGQLATAPDFCGGDVAGGDAVVGTTAYVPCGTGIRAVAVTGTPPRLTVRWRTPTGAGGPPIVAGGLVWTIARGRLYALDPATGSAVQQLDLGPQENSFPTPCVGAGLLLAPAGNRVRAFQGSAGLPAAPWNPGGS